jgi:methylthioribulose-1-phosphate dehydratase
VWQGWIFLSAFFNSFQEYAVSESLLSALAAEAARLSQLGYMGCTAGNVSALLVADPFTVAMSPSGVDKGKLIPSDFIRVDQDAKALAGDTRKPSDEALLHARIYRLVGCASVCHGHPPHAVALSMQPGDHLLLAGIEMQKAFAGITTHHGAHRLPIVENSQDMEELAQAVKKARNPSIPAVLVRGHGVYAWGNSIKEAGRHLEAVEWLARLVWMCRVAGIALPTA